jgi:8-oxo-dGTP pyrophosphatase MutT (NUDIX family)
MAVPRKVLIYAISNRGLLVFDEPDFPHVPLQVPGGTVEPGEELLDAAIREFAEETGLTPAGPFTHLTTVVQTFTYDGKQHAFERSYFHVKLDGDLPESWINIEQTPSGGGPPIRFRLHWTDTGTATQTLDLGTGIALDLISQRAAND